MASEDEGLIPLVPKSTLKVETSTMAIARSMGTAGAALAYLCKRVYSIERMSMSTLASSSELEQLPMSEIDSIKGYYNFYSF